MRQCPCWGCWVGGRAEDGGPGLGVCGWWVGSRHERKCAGAGIERGMAALALSSTTHNVWGLVRGTGRRRWAILTATLAASVAGHALPIFLAPLLFSCPVPRRRPVRSYQGMSRRRSATAANHAFPCSSPALSHRPRRRPVRSCPGRSRRRSAAVLPRWRPTSPRACTCTATCPPWMPRPLL